MYIKKLGIYLIFKAGATLKWVLWVPRKPNDFEDHYKEPLETLYRKSPYHVAEPTLLKLPLQSVIDLLNTATKSS